MTYMKDNDDDNDNDVDKAIVMQIFKREIL